MTLWLVIRRLLSILAVAGLVLAPVTVPALAGNMNMTLVVDAGHFGMPDVGAVDTVMAEMALTSSGDDGPCCSTENKSAVPDCVAAIDGVPFRLSFIQAIISGDEAAPDSFAQAPPPRPPRA